MNSAARENWLTRYKCCWILQTTSWLRKPPAAVRALPRTPTSNISQHYWRNTSCVYNFNPAFLQRNYNHGLKFL